MSFETGNDEEIQPRTLTERISFLDLPYNVREAVYLHTTLVLCCTHSLNQGVPDDIEGLPQIQELTSYADNSSLRLESTMIGPCRLRGVDLVCACLFSTSGDYIYGFPNLFLVSRVVSVETKKLFYSRNKFVVHRCAQNRFRALSVISPDIVSLFTSLRIEVNTAVTTFAWKNMHTTRKWREHCTCHCNDQSRLPKSGYKYCICAKSDSPLSISSERGVQALNTFKDVIQFLARIITPGQLNLGIICDVEDVVTAEAFASAMHKLPRLRDCSIRFSTSSDELMRNVARKTVRKLTRTRDTQLKLSRLSAEIRWRIFEFMGLVAPGDIEWKGSGQRPGYNLHLDYYRNDHICMAVKGWVHSRSSFASSCNCWTYPLELFLLNKEFSAEVPRIFFRKNHFIILPNRGYNLPGDDTDDFWVHQPSPLYSFFFKHLSQLAKENLRSIQFVIPMNGDMLSADTSNNARSSLDSNIPEYWSRSIWDISRYMTLGKLTLVLDFSTLDHRPRPGMELDLQDAPEDWNERFSIFTNSVHQVLAHKGKLKAFYIYPPEHIRPLKIEGPYEKLVMGRDYEVSLQQKYQYPNRFEYWYPFVTGRTIKDSPVGDFMLLN